MNKTNNHNTVIVKKPWGYEYLAYKNNAMSLWLLNIKAGEKTSMHCHPTKTTGLVVVGGIAELNFISDKKIITSPYKQMIRRGLFHQTIAKTDTIMLEAETPIDKNDLVRLHDEYGRKNNSYEKTEYELPKNDECIWIKNPKSDTIDRYEAGECVLYVANATNDILYNYYDNDLVMVLQGGLYKNIEGRHHNVVVPGDVSFVKVVKQVFNEMDGFNEDTILMFIKEKTVL